METAWEKEQTSKHLCAANPFPDGRPGVLRHFELNRPLRLALDNGHAFANPVTNHKIGAFEANKVTTVQLAIDRQIEKCQISEIAREFEPSADCPDLLGKKWALLTNQAPLVSRCAFRFDSGKLNNGH